MIDVRDNECRHGVDARDCSICKHPTPKQVATYLAFGLPVLARFEGQCPVCNLPIYEGESILKTERIRPSGEAVWVHEDCADWIISKDFPTRDEGMRTMYGCRFQRSCGHDDISGFLFLDSLEAEEYERWVRDNGLCQHREKVEIVPPRNDMPPPRYGYPSLVFKICGAK